MGQREAIANLFLALIPMIAAVVAVVTFNVVYPAPFRSGYIGLTLCVLGLLFFITAKISVIKLGRLLSFGTAGMRPLMRYSYWLGYLLMAIGVILTLASASILKHKINNANKVALLEIRDEIEIGDSLQRVVDVYQKHKDNLKLIKANPNNIYIETPLQFGAGNWVLHVEMESSKVTAVKVMTADGPPPTNGPKDKITKNNNLRVE